MPFRDKQEITGVEWNTRYIDLVNCVQQAPVVLTAGTQLEHMIR